MQYKKKKKNKSQKLSKITNLDNSNIYLRFSDNNLIITLTDTKGDTIAFSTPSLMGFKNNRKSNLFAMKASVLDIIEKCNRFNIKNTNLIISGHSRNINDVVKLIGAHLSVFLLEKPLFYLLMELD